MALSVDSTELGHTIASAARTSIQHWGVATIAEVAARISETQHQQVQQEVVQDVLTMQDGFEWLDEEGGWFWISTVTRNRLLYQIEKVMAGRRTNPRC